MPFRYFHFLLMFVLIQNCTYHKTDEIKPLLLESGCDTSKVTYELIVKPILIKHCYTCHTATSTNPNKNDYAFFDDFNQLKDYATKPSVTDSKFTTLQARIRHIESPAMPLNAPKLSECDIVKIEIWIKQGAPNN